MYRNGLMIEGKCLNWTLRNGISISRKVLGRCLKYISELIQTPIPKLSTRFSLCLEQNPNFCLCLKKPFMTCHLPPTLGFSQTSSSTVLEPPFYSYPLTTYSCLLTLVFLSLIHSPGLLMAGSFVSFWFQRDHTSKAASYSLPSYKPTLILNFNTLHYLTFSCEFTWMCLSFIFPVHFIGM